MTELQRNAQVEMLMRRVVSAEAAIKTIAEHVFTVAQYQQIAQRALTFCEYETHKYLRQYPD